MAEFLKLVRFYGCTACGAEWQARGSSPPQQCRSCHSRRWNQPFPKPRFVVPLKPIKIRNARPMSPEAAATKGFRLSAFRA